MVQCKRCLLWIEGKKYVTVTSDKNGPKLVTKDCQENQEPVVYIHEKDTPVANVTTKQIAFHLVCGNSYYSIKVDGTDLKVEEITNSSNHSFTTAHWFTKTALGGGEYFYLESMGNPKYYLACTIDYTVCLRPNTTDCVPFNYTEKP